MRKTLAIYMALAAVVALVPVRSQIVPVLGAQRAGTSTAQFLKVGVGARAAAMGESFVAVANDASALYWNPAGITQFDQAQVILSHTEWLVEIKHDFAGAVYHLSADDAVGVSVTALHTKDMEVTTELQPRGTGNYFTFGDIAVGVTYARKMTNQFSFGATIRYIEETMDVLKMRGVVADFGTYYWTGLGTARFSAVVANFGNQMGPSGTVTLVGGSTVNAFQEYPPPTIFKFGFAFEPIKDETNILTTSIQLNHPNDNSENVGFGAEYGWQNTLFIRGGYKLNAEEQSVSFGGGLAASLGIAHVAVDYAYASFANLGPTHRISLLVTP